MADEDPSAVIDPSVEGTDSFDQFPQVQPVAQTPVAQTPAPSTTPDSGTPTKKPDDFSNIPLATAGVGLATDFDQKVVQWQAAVKDRLGLDVHITEGYRDPKRSDQLRAQGVIALPGGQSYHNYGQAFDYGFQTPKGVDLHNEKGYADAEKIAHEYGITGISTESGHLQNNSYKTLKDVKASQGWSQFPEAASPTTSTPTDVGSISDEVQKNRANLPHVKTTEYGPQIDAARIGPNHPDSRIGDRGNTLTEGDVALTESERQDLFGVTGKSTGKTFTYQGQIVRDADTAPESDRRVDIWRRGGSQQTAAEPQTSTGSVWDRFPLADPKAQSTSDELIPPTQAQRAFPATGDDSYGVGAAIPRGPSGISDLSPSAGKEGYGDSASAAASVQHGLPSGANAEDYGASAGMSRGPVATPRDPNDPFELQIIETQNNPDLNDAQKKWMIQSLRIQQAKANPEPEVRRALPVGQFADTAPVEVRPAQSVEGGYAVPSYTPSQAPPTFKGSGAAGGGASGEWEAPEGTVDNVTRAIISSIPQGALKSFEGVLRFAASAPQIPGIDSDEDYQNGKKKLSQAADWFKTANDQLESEIHPDVQQNPVVGVVRGAGEFVPAMVMSMLVPEIELPSATGFIAKALFQGVKNLPFAVASIPTIAADSFDRGKAELANRTDLTEEQKNEISNRKMLIDSGVNFALFTSLPGVSAQMTKGSLAGLLSRYVEGATLLGGSQLASNLSTKALTNPKQEPWQGVLQAAASGVAMTGISHALEHLTKLAEPITRPPAIQTPGEAQKSSEARPSEPVTPSFETTKPGPGAGAIREPVYGPGGDVQVDEEIQKQRVQPTETTPQTEEEQAIARINAKNEARFREAEQRITPKPTIVDPGESKEARNARLEYEQEMQRTSQEGQPELLSEVQRAGGLPTVQQLRKMPGENLTGELGRVYDAWKALDQDAKNWLKKQGIQPTKLFRHDAPGLDTMRDNLAQSEGFSFDHPHEMLSEIEDALNMAHDRKLKLAQNYATVGGEGADIPFATIPRGGTPEGRQLPESGGARPRYEWDQLTGKEQAAFTRKASASVETAYAKLKPLFDALGVRRATLAESRGRHLAARMDPNGELVLLHDPLNFAKQFYRSDRVNRSMTVSPESAAKMLEEELIHFAQHAALRDRWQGAQEYSSAQSLSEFVIQENAKIWDSLDQAARQHWAAGDKQAAEDLLKARNDSIRLYHGIEPGRTVPELNAREKSLATYELVRQLVQIRRSGTLTEELWRHIRNWWSDALNGLRKLAGRVTDATSSRQLERMIAETEAQLRNAEAKRPSPEPTARQQVYRQGTLNLEGNRFGLETPISRAIREARGISPEAPRIQQVAGQKVGGRTQEEAERYKTLAARVGESGESFFLGHEETKPLAQAEHTRVSNAQAIGQRVGIRNVERAFQAVPRSGIKQFVKEFTDYYRHTQTKQAGPPPPVGPKTKAVIDAWRNFADKTGDEALRLGVEVRQSDGTIRPLRKIGPDYFPRIVSTDTYDIFENRDGRRAADFTKLVAEYNADAVQKGRPVFTRDEFIDQFIRSYQSELTSSEHFSNLNKARELELPLSFYDFSPEAIGRYMQRAVDTLGRYETYGQRIGSSRDFFDISKDRVTASRNLSPEQKQIIIDRISSDQRAEYDETWRSPLTKVTGQLRQGASGVMLGTPITSVYNYISHAGKALIFGGPTSFTKMAIRFLDAPYAISRIEEAHERGILRSTLRSTLANMGIADTPMVGKFAQGALKWGGFHATDVWTRVMGMQQAKYILSEFSKIRGIRNDTPAREMYDMITRRMGRDVLDQLAAERGKGPLTDEFIRQYVNDVFGTYHYSQNPSWMFTPTWGTLTQFQLWGGNTTRMMTREFVAPLARSFANKDVVGVGYNATRALGFVAGAVGVGVAQQMYRQLITGKDPNDPTFAEIGKAFSRGDFGLAFHWGLNRALSAVAMSGLMGTLGDVAQYVPKLMGQPTQRFHNLAEPPITGLFLPFVSLAVGWAGENGFRGAPSRRLMDTFLSSMSAQYRFLKQGSLRLAEVSGLKWQPAEEQAAMNDLGFLRSRIKMFSANNPVYAAKIARQGTMQTTMLGRTEFAPFKDDLEAALLTGNTHQAAATIRAWLQRFPPAERDARLKSLRESVSASEPIRVAGGTGATAQTDFMKWAHVHLPPEEVARMRTLVNTYSRTAARVGLRGGEEFK